MSCWFLVLLCATCVQAQASHREVCAEGESACADTSSRALLQSQATPKASPIQKVISLMEGMAEKGKAHRCEWSENSGCGSISGSGVFECQCEGKMKDFCMEKKLCPAYSWKPPKPESGFKGKHDWYPETIKGKGDYTYKNLYCPQLGRSILEEKDVLLKGKKASAAREGRHNKFFTSCQQSCDRCSSCQAIAMMTTIKGKRIYRQCQLRANVVYTESTFDLTRAYKFGKSTEAFPVSGWTHMVNDKAGMRQKPTVDCGKCGIWIPGNKLPCKCKAGCMKKGLCKATWFDPLATTKPKPKPKPEVDCGKFGSWVPGEKLPCKCKSSGFIKKGYCPATWFDPRTTTITTTQAKTPPAKQPEGTLFDRLDVDNNNALSRKEFQSMGNRSDDSKLSDNIAKRVIERLRALFAGR